MNLNQHGSLCIVAKYSIVQVSCIHTCQGPEVHYKGVIIGPDLVIRDGEVRTVPATRDCHYRSIRSHKTGISTDPVAVTCETHPTIKDPYAHRPHSDRTFSAVVSATET